MTAHPQRRVAPVWVREWLVPLVIVAFFVTVYGLAGGLIGT